MAKSESLWEENERLWGEGFWENPDPVQTSLRSAFNCFYDNKINSDKPVISDIFFTNMVISSIFLIEMVIFNIKSQSWILYIWLNKDQKTKFIIYLKIKDTSAL